jgi:NTE family protein
LKALEEYRIPIDYIGGTSMGSIVAGLHASGTAPDEMERFLEGLDWNEVMSDATPRRELYFHRKEDDQRYLFEIGCRTSTGRSRAQAWPPDRSSI